MAYMNQEKKARIVELVKPIMKKYGVKGTFAVRNHSTLVLNIKSGKIDFYKDFSNEEDARKFGIQVNPYWYRDHFTGKAKAFLSEVIPAMNAGNHDNSDIQTDYFDVGWYIDVNIGQWKKPYEVV